jgi:hypothetical protein
MPMSPRKYHPPVSQHGCGAGAYAGGGMMEGMSAANAVVDNIDAAPAAIRNLTLRIGSVLLAGEATGKASHLKTHGWTIAPKP